MTAVTSCSSSSRENEDVMVIPQRNVRLPFRDREEAARLLPNRLQAYAQRSDVMIVGLPRGGVPVAAEIARALHASLRVLVVRKLGVPGHEELAMGAVTSGNRKLINSTVTIPLHISQSEIDSVVQRELQEVVRRERLYCRGAEMPSLEDKLVIIADDGIATSSSMLLAVETVRAQGAAYVLVAVPVAPVKAIASLASMATEVVCLATPEPFVTVGRWYEDFHQVDDHEVCLILDRIFEKSRALETR